MEAKRSTSRKEVGRQWVRQSLRGPPQLMVLETESWDLARIITRNEETVAGVRLLVLAGMVEECVRHGWLSTEEQLEIAKRSREAAFDHWQKHKGTRTARVAMDALMRADEIYHDLERRLAAHEVQTDQSK